MPVLSTDTVPVIVSPGLVLSSADKTFIWALACIGIILKSIIDETAASFADVTLICTSHPVTGAPADCSLIEMVTA